MKLSDSRSGVISAVVKIVTLLIGLFLVKTQLAYFGVSNFGRWTNVATLMGLALLFDPGKANAIRKEISLRGIDESKKSLTNVIFYYRNVSLIVTLFVVLFWYQVLKVDYLKYVIVFLPFIFLFKIVNVVFLSTKRAYIIYIIEFIIIFFQLILWYILTYLNAESLLFIHFAIPLVVYFLITKYQLNMIDIDFIKVLTKFERNRTDKSIPFTGYLYMQLWYVISVYAPLWFIYFAHPETEQLGFTYKMYLILYGLCMAVLSPLWSRVSENMLRDSDYQQKFLKKIVIASVGVAFIWVLTYPIQFVVLGVIESSFQPKVLDIAVGTQFAILTMIQIPVVFMAGRGIQRRQANHLLYSSLALLMLLACAFCYKNVTHLYIIIDVFLFVFYIYFMKNVFRIS